MAIRMPRIVHAKQILRRSFSASRKATSHEGYIQKGHFAVYVGKREMKRFVIPLSYLSQPLFQELLSQSEEEFGFDHAMGGLTIPCREDIFIDLIAQFG